MSDDRTKAQIIYWTRARARAQKLLSPQLARTAKVIQIKDSEDLKAHLADAKDKLVVIDFMATWCVLCKGIAPTLDDLAKELADQIIIVKIDIDECDDIAAEYNITAIPTFFFVKNNKQLEDFTSANIDTLKASLNKHK